MDHVFSHDVIAILRKRCADLSLLQLREYSAITYEAITDLSFFSEADLAIGTPVHAALPGAILDILFGGSSDRQGTLFVLVYLFSILCVGFNAPIDFKEGALSDWLEKSQSVAIKVLSLYSHQFYVNDFGLINPAHEADRASAERTLQSLVLPKVDLRFMPMTSMELHYGSHVYRTNLDADVPQVAGDCTPTTP